jgi:hypothetical protein
MAETAPKSSKEVMREIAEKNTIPEGYSLEQEIHISLDDTLISEVACQLLRYRVRAIRLDGEWELPEWVYKSAEDIVDSYIHEHFIHRKR